MKKRIVIIGLLLSFSFCLNAQHCIGLHKDDLDAWVKMNYKGFHLDRSAKNEHFNYIKYVDNRKEQTILFFLDDDDRCLMVRHMSDYSNINDKIEELNSKYTKVDDNTWIYEHEQKVYQVTLKEGEWFFTISTREQKKK